MVGYQGCDKKSIPRWATDYELLLKVLDYQKQHINPDHVFGSLNPKKVQEQFDLEKVFSKGTNAEDYDDIEERGSSADWNDNSEFASPNMTNPLIPNLKAMQETKNLNVSAEPCERQKVKEMKPSCIPEEDGSNTSNVIHFAPYKGGSFGGQYVNAPNP